MLPITHLKPENTGKLKVKERKMICHSKINTKKPMWVSEKVDSDQDLITDKEFTLCSWHHGCVM